MPQANRFVTARITFRKSTTLEWQENDPVLFLGEPAIDTTSNKIKIGDGESKWSDLPYVESVGVAPTEWENDGSGIFPGWVDNKIDAINYTKYRNDLLDNAISYFQAGIDQSSLGTLHELVLISGTGGEATIGGQRKFNSYQEGTQVNITAVSLSSYVFDGWTGLLSGENDSASTTVTMSQPRTLTAKFRKAN